MHACYFILPYKAHGHRHCIFELRPCQCVCLKTHPCFAFSFIVSHPLSSLLPSAEAMLCLMLSSSLKVLLCLPGCYPFYKTDPFIFTDCPHIYFCGNAPFFKSKVAKGKTAKEGDLMWGEQAPKNVEDFHFSWPVQGLSQSFVGFL